MAIINGIVILKLTGNHVMTLKTFGSLCCSMKKLHLAISDLERLMINNFHNSQFWLLTRETNLIKEAIMNM